MKLKAKYKMNGKKRKRPRKEPPDSGACSLKGKALHASCGVGAGDSAEDDDIGNCVAAQTVAAMDAAGHLARSVQAGDDVSFGIQHVALGIHLNAAHGMMRGGAIRRIRSVVFSRS